MSKITELYQLVALPKITDSRGNLSFIEGNNHVPFEICRTYWLYDIPGASVRGEGHAYHTAHEFIIPLSGSFMVDISNGMEKRSVELRSPNTGLYIKNLTWRMLHSFTTNAVALILSSSAYQEDDYIYDWKTYKALVNL